MPREGFLEVIMPDSNLSTRRFGRFTYDEHITLKEARIAVWAVEWDSEDPEIHGKKLLRLVDYFGCVLALAKGRASSFEMLQRCTRLSA